MELNNYIRIEIPFISKGLSPDSKGYKYKGVAHYLIRKKDKRIVFETMKLDEEQEIIGASNYIDGKMSDYYINSIINKPLKDTRLEMFDWLTKRTASGKGRSNKIHTKYKGKISKLNDLILSKGFTIKSVVGYISGSNAGGGLSNPKADEIGAYWVNEDPIRDIYGQNLKTENNFWKIFSSITAISNKDRNNTKFKKNLTWEKLFDIEKVSIKYLFENDYKIVPWGKKSEFFEEDYVDFKRGIASQNREYFIEEYCDWDILLFDKKYRDRDAIERIKEKVENVDWDGLKNELRAIWTLRVNKNIKTNLFTGDFVKDKIRFKRCHIIENKEAKEVLFDESIIWEDKVPFIESLIDENNYLLLDGNLHDYWDNTDSILINSNGQIINNGLNEKEFLDLVGDNNNIYNIYPNVNNGKRQEFLEYRIRKNQ